LTKIDNKLVRFQGELVEKGYRDAYMYGYRKPYKPIKHGKYSAAQDAGRTAGRQASCLEGTF